MEEDQDNSNIQINAESSSAEVNCSPQQKDLLATEKSPESEKEKHIDKDSSLDKKDTRGKGSLLFLTLIITLAIGFYFFTKKNNGDFFTYFPEDFKKLFLTTTKTKSTLDNELEKKPLTSFQEVPKKIEGTGSPDTQLNEMRTTSEEEIVEKESFSVTKPNKKSARSSKKEVVDEKNSLDIQPKGIPSKLPGKTIEQTKTTNTFDQTTNENKKTINVLRDEIRSLKSELKEKNSSIFQKLRPKNPDATPGVVKESISKTKASSETSLPTKAKSLIPQNYPQRSKEVQAYLDFIENTGRKFFELIKDGWESLKKLAIEFEKKYLKEY